MVLRRGDPAAEMAVERERRRDPRNFAREFGAEFADDIGSIWSSDDIAACTDGVDNRPPAECVYWMAIDVGLRRDWTAISVFHCELRRREGGPPTRVLVIDAVRILKPTLLRRLEMDDVEQAIEALSKRYGVKKILGDIHYADELAARARARGRVFEEVSNGPRDQEKRAAALAARIAGRSIRLVDVKELRDQLVNLREFRRAGGLSSFSVPESKGHDDVVDTVLIAAGVVDEMPVSTAGSDYRCEIEAHYELGIGFDIEPKWYERSGSSWVRCLPPFGSPAREAAEQEMASRGAYMPEGERSIDVPGTIEGASVEIHGLDPRLRNDATKEKK